MENLVALPKKLTKLALIGSKRDEKKNPLKCFINHLNLYKTVSHLARGISKI